MSYELQGTIRLNTPASAALQRMISHVNTLNNGFERMNRHLRRLGGNGGARQLSEELNRANQRIQRMERSIQQSTLRIRSSNLEIRELRQKFEQASEQIKAMNMQLEASKREITQLSAKVGELEQELQRIKEEQEKVNQGQKQFNSGISSGSNGMKRLLGIARNLAITYLSFQSIKKVMDLSDIYTNTNARLSMINDGLRTQDQLQKEIYLGALRSRGAYQDLAQVTSKLGLLAADAFQNNDELQYFTEMMQKSFKVSGASTQEVNAAMYQLTQAMASGKLQGDEYRSILENAPMLAKSIEKYMQNAGVKGVMKEWASDGLLTADVIKNALFQASDEINQKFESMPMTFGDMWNQISSTAFMIFGPVLEQINGWLNEVFTSDSLRGLIDFFSGISIRVSSIIIRIKGLFEDMAPFIAQLSQQLAGVIRQIFSVNGLFGALLRRMSKLARNTGIQQFFSTLVNGLMNAVKMVTWLIETIGNLMNSFSGLMPIIGGAIVAFTTFKVLNSAFLPIAQAVGMGISIMRGNTTALTSALLAATGAQNGLNAAMNANPYVFVASAIMTVVTAVISLISAIGALNKTAGLTSDLQGLGGYSKEAWKIHKEKNISLSSAQAIADVDAEYQKTYDENWGIYQQSKKDINKFEENLKRMEINPEIYDADNIRLTRERLEQAEAQKVDAMNNITDAGNQYFELKDNIYAQEKQRKELQNSIDGIANPTDFTPQIEVPVQANQQLDAIKDDTSRIADSIDLSVDYLELMRDLAEKEVVNKFTTVPLQLNVNNTNNINSELDADAMVAYIGNTLLEGVNTVAEGVHF